MSAAVKAKTAKPAPRMPFPPPSGRLPSIEWVPITELELDDSYQRSVETGASRKLIAGIANRWDWDLLDVLKVSRRPDERKFVIDGQHRKAAAVMRGDIPQLPCVLKRCSGPEEEARMFVAANRGRKAMSGLDDFRAAVGSGDAEATTIARLVDAAGLNIPRHYVASAAPPGAIPAVAGLRTILKRRGEDLLGQALMLVGEAFPDEVLVTPMPMIHALVDLIAAGGVDHDRLFATLLTGTTGDWAEWSGLAAIRGGGGRMGVVRNAIMARYASIEVAA